MPKIKTIIVLVDDNSAVRRALKFSLELDGFEVHACGSGEDLLGHDALKACDCIVLDYMMPGMDGLEVLDKLKWRKKSLRRSFSSRAPSPKVFAKALCAGAHVW